MRLSKFGSLLVGLMVSAAAWSASGQQIVATPKEASGVYGTGDKIEWKIEVQGAEGVKQIHYVLKKGALTPMKEGDVELASGAATLQTSLDEPGTILGELKAKAGDKDLALSVGAIVAPEKIQPSMPKPDDFDAFWKAKIDELVAIPVNAKVEAGESGVESVDYYKVQLDNIHGTHVIGQLARPKKEGKYPALLLVQYAGVYALPKTNVTSRAQQGWLALDIMAHDLPFDQPEDFYKKAAATTLKDYITIGNDDREKSYFLRMYLGCYRACEYLTQHDDWDGKVLVVTGGSQGGQQTILTAAIFPKVTAMLANVPAGCDTTGPTVGRASGFPYFANAAKQSGNDKIAQTGRYFDLVNFASRVKCPAMVGTGLIDRTCPAAGVLATYNQFQGPKEIEIMVNSEHIGKGNTQAKFYARSEAWLRELVKGNAPTVKPLDQTGK